MWLHKHPYPPYIPKNTTRLIVGTLPPPRFSTGALNDQDVDFCYGSSSGMLWKIWDRLYDLNLVFENTNHAIEQRKAFLKRERFGICDIVGGACRDKIDASDLGMQDVQLRDVLSILEHHPKVDTLILTGGNSKNGPEYFLRKLLKKSYYSIGMHRRSGSSKASICMRWQNNNSPQPNRAIWDSKPRDWKYASI